MFSWFQPKKNCRSIFQKYKKKHIGPYIVSPATCSYVSYFFPTTYYFSIHLLQANYLILQNKTSLGGGMR